MATDLEKKVNVLEKRVESLEDSLGSARKAIARGSEDRRQLLGHITNLREEGTKTLRALQKIQQDLKQDGRKYTGGVTHYD